MSRAALALAALAALAACDSGDDGAASLLAAPRLLAVVSEPAEAPPGASLQVAAVALGPGGPAADGAAWGRCSQRKPLTELGPVDPACMRADPTALVPLDPGPSSSLVIPADACRLFGPDRPDPRPGEPAGRPVDPDPSGGYYLPLRVELERRVSAGFVRLKCDIGGATQEAAIAYGKSYRPNQNPAVASLSLSVAGVAREVTGDEAIPVAPGSAVALEVRWPVCPTTPACGDGVCSPAEEVAACPADCEPLRGCSGAEDFAYYDPTNQQVSVRREDLRVSWYITGGALDNDATGPSLPAGDGSTNRWQAPTTPGEYWVAAVLRDSRGGAGHRFARVRVQ